MSLVGLLANLFILWLFSKHRSRVRKSCKETFCICSGSLAPGHMGLYTTVYTRCIATSLGCWSRSAKFCCRTSDVLSWSHQCRFYICVWYVYFWFMYSTVQCRSSHKTITILCARSDTDKCTRSSRHFRPDLRLWCT